MVSSSVLQADFFADCTRKSAASPRGPLFPTLDCFGYHRRCRWKSSPNPSPLGLVCPTGTSPKAEVYDRVGHKAAPCPLRLAWSTARTRLQPGRFVSEPLHQRRVVLRQLRPDINGPRIIAGQLGSCRIRRSNAHQRAKHADTGALRRRLGPGEKKIKRSQSTDESVRVQIIASLECAD